jgi:hypothetical protein
MLALLASLLLAGEPATAPAAPERTAPLLNHIMIVWGENTKYTSARAQPYMSSLATANAEFTQFFGVTHPSMPNYIAMTGGSLYVTSNVGCTTLDVTNLADLVEGAGLDWRGYNESMVTPCVDNGSYVSKHDFFVNYKDVKENPARLAKVKGFNSTQSATYSELMGPNPPEVVFITPNLCHDGHDCGVATFDNWLAGTNGDTFFQDMLSSEYFTDGAIFISFDEDDGTQGNHVYTVAIGAQARSAFIDSATYNHYSLLRTIEDNFGLGTLTANDVAASNMLGAFQPRASAVGWEMY